MSADGHLALVLHAHLPFVRHPEHEQFLEEDWLFEAITESYIPLLLACESMVRDGVPFRLTLSMSPPLVAMLADDLLRQRYWGHLRRLRELVGKELVRTRDHGHLSYLAGHYCEQIDACMATWQRLSGNLVGAFAELQEQGYLDILSCAATHGYLPLLRPQPEAVWAQIRVGVQQHEEHFGRPPTGFWLPECGTYEGLDLLLAEAGVRYVVCDAHALLLARPRPTHGNHAPVYTADAGVAAFGRDMESSMQVWSREHGYPGDPLYREFYRDIGYDLPEHYIGPYIQPDGQPKNTGIKYHRITGNGGLKELYDPYWARHRAGEHAADFLAHRQLQLARLSGRAPIVVSPYDAELFGHWWYEGPWWLEALLRQTARQGQGVRLSHLAGYLRANPTHQVCRLGQSSWGHQGFHGYWLNNTNEWIYPLLHDATERMIGLSRQHRRVRGLRRRALNQAARELLLSQSSDWAFIMRTGTAVEYAEKRTRSHLRRFHHLCDMVRDNRVERQWLGQLEAVDNLFANIDFRVYLGPDAGADGAD